MKCDGLGPCGNRNCPVCRRLARLAIALGADSVLMIVAFSLLIGAAIEASIDGRHVARWCQTPSAHVQAEKE